MKPLRLSVVALLLAPFAAAAPRLAAARAIDRVPAGTNHGAPHAHDAHLPLAWSGAGGPAGGHVGRIGSDAIAPTRARILGGPVPLPAHAALRF